MLPFPNFPSTTAGVTSIYGFVKQDGTQRMMVFDDAGVLKEETTQDGGSYSTIQSGLPTGAYMNGTTLFGRAFLAFSDGMIGNFAPQWFDDGGLSSSLQQVGQDGPGTIFDPATGVFTRVSLSAYDHSLKVAITAVGAVSGGLRQITAPGHGLTTTGQLVVIDGAKVVTTGADMSINGTWSITFVDANNFKIADATTDTWDGSSGTAAPGQGAGVNISVGKHKLTIFYETESGYLTSAMPPVEFELDGNHGMNIHNLPYPPSNCVKAFIACTASGGTDFYYIPGSWMEYRLQSIVPVNGIFNILDGGENPSVASGQVNCTFDDALLLAGVRVDDPNPGGLNVFNRLTLPAQAGFCSYKDRLVSWGERTNMNYLFYNLSFDGGSVLTGTPSVAPSGWNREGSGKDAGFNIDLASNWPGASGVNVYTAKASTGAQRATLTQFAKNLLPNTTYRVRVRAMITANFAANADTNSNLVVWVDSTNFSGGASGAIFPVTHTGPHGEPQLTTSWQTLDAAFLPSQTSIDPDAVLKIGINSGGGTYTGVSVVVDGIEIYDANHPTAPSLVRVSMLDDPESFDPINGVLTVGPDDGQAVRCCFVLGNTLHIAKERSLYAATDTGTEPASWTIEQVSDVVGTNSVRGVAVGERWATIMSRAGLYLFDGSAPTKISQEIEPTWETIDWANTKNAWVVADHERKWVMIGVPTTGGTTNAASFTPAPNVVWQRATPGTWPQPGDHVYPADVWSPGIFGPYAVSLGGGGGCRGDIHPGSVWDLEMAAAHQYGGPDVPPGYLLGVPPSVATKPTYLGGGDAYCQGSHWVDANGFQFTVPTVMPGGPPPAGGVVDNRARASNIATIHTTTAHGIVVGQSFTLTAMGGTGYNGLWIALTVPDSTHVTFQNPGADETSTACDGLMIVSVGGPPPPPTNIIVYRQRTSNVATLTTQSPHGLLPNDSITVQAVGGTGYNGSFTVIDTPTSTQFTYADTGANEGLTADGTGTFTLVAHGGGSGGGGSGGGGGAGIGHTPDTILVIDYTDGFGDPFEGEGIGRKWCPWNYQARDCKLIERSTGKRRTVFGMASYSTNANHLSYYDPNTHTDYRLDAVATTQPIKAYYQTSYASATGLVGRSQFSGLVVRAYGYGNLAFLGVMPDETTFFIRTLYLGQSSGALLKTRDLERLFFKRTERLSVQFGTSGATSDYFEISKFAILVRPDPFAPWHGRSGGDPSGQGLNQ